MNLKTPVIHRKGAKDANKIKDLPEVPESFVIQLLGLGRHRFIPLARLRERG